MINKKTLLGMPPDSLGVKDAIHIAVVSLRAGQLLKPGQNIELNEDGEAIRSRNKKDSFGVVDPFLKNNVMRGESFWGLLSMHEVPNVRHTWDHPKLSFESPITPIKYNSILEHIASELGITYPELMFACRKMIDTDKKTAIQKSEDEIYSLNSDYNCELWSEWSDETGEKFTNNGTACCPEYDYPDFPFEARGL